MTAYSNGNPFPGCRVFFFPLSHDAGPAVVMMRRRMMHARMVAGNYARPTFAEWSYTKGLMVVAVRRGAPRVSTASSSVTPSEIKGRFASVVFIDWVGPRCDHRYLKSVASFWVLKF
jgi:hypothetical protein